MTTLRNHAQRGAAWLDKHLPGWFRKVDVKGLDVRYTETCVIGQLFGDFNAWEKRVGRVFSLKHGFRVRHHKEKNWQMQTAVWIEEISHRLGREIQMAMAG